MSTKDHAVDASLAKHDADGLPGTVTETSLILRPDMKITEWVKAIRLLGRMNRGMSWWICDALIYGEDHYGEKMAQYAEETNLSVHSIANMLWVGRAWPRSRRREALSFGHHEALAAMESEDQTHWAGMAEQGETLPNGERKPWSVTRLREELRAVRPGRKKAEEPVAAPISGSNGHAIDVVARLEPAPEPPVAAAEGPAEPPEPPRRIEIPATYNMVCVGDTYLVQGYGICKVTAIAKGPIIAMVTFSKVSEDPS